MAQELVFAYILRKATKHNRSYNPNLGISTILASLRGVLPVWYFGGDRDSDLGVYETHSGGAFRERAMVDGFRKLAPARSGYFATWC
jgi:hypothetical protein